MKFFILLCLCLSAVIALPKQPESEFQDSRRRLQRLSLQVVDGDDEVKPKARAEDHKEAPKEQNLFEDRFEQESRHDHKDHFNSNNRHAQADRSAYNDRHGLYDHRDLTDHSAFNDRQELFNRHDQARHAFNDRHNFDDRYAQADRGAFNEYFGRGNRFEHRARDGDGYNSASQQLYREYNKLGRSRQNDKKNYNSELGESLRNYGSIGGSSSLWNAYGYPYSGQNRGESSFGNLDRQYPFGLNKELYGQTHSDLSQSDLNKLYQGLYGMKHFDNFHRNNDKYSHAFYPYIQYRADNSLSDLDKLSLGQYSGQNRVNSLYSNLDNSFNTIYKPYGYTYDSYNLDDQYESSSNCGSGPSYITPNLILRNQENDEDSEDDKPDEDQEE